jgi:hypothetical protein
MNHPDIALTAITLCLAIGLAVSHAYYVRPRR